MRQIDTPYPICFYGTIAELIPKKETFPYAKIKLNSPYIRPINGRVDLPSIELLLANKQLRLDDFLVEQEILVYGQVNIKMNQWSPANNNKNIQYHYINMNIWINHKGQIIVL